MNRIRSRYLFLFAAVSDLVLVFGAPPLQLVSWSVARQHPPQAQVVVLLLAANAALFVFLTGGMLCATVLARRGIRLAFRRAAKSFVRPSRAQ